MQEDALKLLERAKQLNPASDGAEFKSLLERVIELDPSSGEPHIYLGLYYYKLKNIEKACEDACSDREYRNKSRGRDRKRRRHHAVDPEKCRN